MPRSSIYVTSSTAPTETKQVFKFQTDVSKFHFYLILKCGVHYTQEDLEHANGKYQCHNCGRKIQDQVYFYPERFDVHTNRFICNPTPHCRTACVYRTLQDLKNNDDYLTNFFLMYGNQVNCAPDRFLLSIPGGLSLEEYHRSIDESVVFQTHPQHIRAFPGPVYVSCTLLKDHQLVPDVISYLEELNIDPKCSNIGPARDRDDSTIQVKTLSPKSLRDSQLSKVFPMDPRSFNRNTTLAQNPHMQ